MAIDWKKGGASSPDCCSDCHDLVCAATECMDIKLCKNGKPESPKC